MKKIYSLLLLGGLLFFGVQSVWAHTVTINVKTSTKYILYAWNINGSEKYNGEWGEESDIAQAITDGYKYVLTTVGNNANLGLIFKDGGNQTRDLKPGIITADVTFTYELSSTSTWELKTGADGWAQHVSCTSEITIPLTAGDTYEFGVSDFSQSWYAAGSTWTDLTMTSLNCTEWGLATGEGTKNLKITPSTTGNYKFIWDDTNKKLSVIFPSYLVTIGSLGYATLRLPVEVQIDENLTAVYYESAYSHNKTTNVVSVTFAALTGDYIPAGLPVILHGAEGSYSLTHTSTGASDPRPIGIDQFKGKYSKTYCNDLGLSGSSAYVLQDYESGGEHHFGFHLLRSTGWIEASRCYLEVGSSDPVNAPSVRMYLPGDATNIENIETIDEGIKYMQNGKLFIKKNGVVYDMTGRVVK